MCTHLDGVRALAKYGGGHDVAVTVGGDHGAALADTLYLGAKENKLFRGRFLCRIRAAREKYQRDTEEQKRQKEEEKKEKKEKKEEKKAAKKKDDATREDAE